jgi:hypothetical protein
MGVERVSKKGSAADEAEHDEHKGHGPLAPWRLCVAVVLSAALTGPALWDAAMADRLVDFALLRSFGVFFLAWFSMGVINRTLVRAMMYQSPRRAAGTTELVDQ